jgi:hypothetical protein
MAIIAWEGVSRQLADNAYDTLRKKLPKYGLPLEVNVFTILNDIKQYIKFHLEILFVIYLSFF